MYVNGNGNPQGRRPLPSMWEAEQKWGFGAVMRPRFVEAGRCEWCGEKLTGRRTSVCSSECRKLFSWYTVWNSGARGGYAGHLLRRASFSCQECGELHALENKNGILLPVSDGQLEIHHITHVEHGGDDSPDNLIVLCKDCHKKKHSKHVG